MFIDAASKTPRLAKKNSCKPIYCRYENNNIIMHNRPLSIRNNITLIKTSDISIFASASPTVLQRIYQQN